MMSRGNGRFELILEQIFDNVSMERKERHT